MITTKISVLTVSLKLGLPVKETWLSLLNTLILEKLELDQPLARESRKNKLSRLFREALCKNKKSLTSNSKKWK